MNCLYYQDSHLLRPDESIWSLRTMFKSAKDNNLVISVGKPFEYEDKTPEGSVFFDLGEIKSEYNALKSIPQWMREFTTINTPKPFWFQGKRHSPEELEAIIRVLLL